MPVLLLHLPALYAERCIFGSASASGCLLVVADSQAAKAENNASSLADTFFGLYIKIICSSPLAVSEENMAKCRKRKVCCRIEESIIQEIEQIRDKTGLPVSKLIELRLKGFTIISVPQKRVTLEEIRQMSI